MEIKINEAIHIFSDFLNSTWHIVKPLLSDRSYTTAEDAENDWLQANWELLIERKVLSLNSYLEVYGSGGDYNGESSRITDFKALPTYRVDVLVKQGNDLLNKIQIKNQKFHFDRLVGYKDGFYINDRPFNYVLAYDPETLIERVFPLDDVTFILILI